MAETETKIGVEGICDMFSHYYTDIAQRYADIGREEEARLFADGAGEFAQLGERFQHIQQTREEVPSNTDNQSL